MTDFGDRYGPCALVTGASSGIGWAFAEALAARGLDLLLVARRVDRLEALAGRLRAGHSVDVRTAAIDLARVEAPEAVMTAADGLDIGLVVSNAGFGLKGAHEECDPGGISAMLMVNCNMPMRLAHGFAPRLRARGRGGILLVSSIEALIGCPYSGAYSASKALVNAFGEALWAELEPAGIDVLTLCPGATESEAAAKQGIDLTALADVMPARDVAEFALDRLGDGPVVFSSAAYKERMDRLLALPKRDALRMMATGMKR